MSFMELNSIIIEQFAPYYRPLDVSTSPNICKGVHRMHARSH